MEKKIWFCLIVGLCCISSLKAQDGDSAAFDDFDPLEEEYAIDQRGEYLPDDEDGTILGQREFEDEPDLEDVPFREFEDEPPLEDVHFREFDEEPPLEDVHFREFEEGPEPYDEQMEEEIDERAEEEKETEGECEALARGKKNTCETDVESDTEKDGEKTKDRFILNRKAQTFTDLAKAGLRRQIFHIDYKRDVAAIALQRRKVCLLYKLPAIMKKKSGGTFGNTAKKVAAFSKELTNNKRSLWKKARYVWTRYSTSFQFTDAAVNKSALGTTITDKICKGLNMKWVKVVKTRGQTETKDKKKEQRQQEDPDPSQSKDLEERAAARNRAVCRAVFVKSERQVTKVYKCGWLWQDTCRTYQPVKIYTMRCN